MGLLTIECAIGQVSDGDHTFNELYDHRNLLFLNLMILKPDQAWFSKLHNDGSHHPGYFIAGMNLPTRQISYHMPDKYWIWAGATNAKELEVAPPWDGHTSKDVTERLQLNLDRHL